MLEIRQLTEADISMVNEVFSKHNIPKSKGYLTKCWGENQQGCRITLLAFYDDEFVGALHLLEKSNYPYFQEKGIPEINDLNVIPTHRKKGVGNALLDAIEKLAFEKYGVVGLGVGLYSSYGSAQRIYAKRGYIPDGRGVMYNNRPVKPGSEVRLDDDLNLFFIKRPRV